MKEKIMYLILGILIGAVITAGAFLVFSKDKGQRGGNRRMPDFSDMSDEEREEIMTNHSENGEPKKPEDGEKTNNISNNEVDTTAINSLGNTNTAQ